MIEQITQALENAVKDLTGEDHEIVLEQARDFNRGDFACSVAMQLAKILGKPPINLAKELVPAQPAQTSKCRYSATYCAAAVSQPRDCCMARWRTLCHSLFRA